MFAVFESRIRNDAIQPYFEEVWMDLEKENERITDSACLFRYRLVAAVLAREAGGEVRTVAVTAVAAETHPDPNGDMRKVSTRSLYRWIAAFEKGGLHALAPRKRVSHPGAIVHADLLGFAVDEKKTDPTASIPEIIRRACQRGITGATDVSRVTLWRALRAHGCATQRRKQRKPPQHRFAYDHRMQMVMCDGKHFRAGVNRHKRVALFFLDDATRLVLDVVVGTSEKSSLFLRGVERCIRRYGLMKRLYTDHGSGFTAGDCLRALDYLNILYIQGRVGYPQARGKVERFNRTVEQDLLRFWSGSDISSDCTSLEQRLRHYVDTVYNERFHHSLGRSPRECFESDTVSLNWADPKQLHEAFIQVYQRRVSNDATVSVMGSLLEVPHGYAGQQIKVWRHLWDGTFFIIHQGQPWRLHAPNLGDNARRLPIKTQPDHAETVLPTTVSSAQLAYQQTYKTLVDDQGNFFEPQEQQ